MPPVGQIASSVDRPGHDVRDAGWNLLVAAGAAVGFRGRIAGNRSHEPVAVARRVDPLDTAAGAALVQRRHVGGRTVVSARAHDARVRWAAALNRGPAA